MKKLLVLMLMLTSFNAFAARVECDSLSKILQVPDEPCEAISSAAERCFAQLYGNLHSLKISQAPNRSEGLRELAVDYDRETRKIRNQYMQTLLSYGEGKACTDQVGEVEVILEDINKDSSELKRLLSGSSR
jgi:hypothetical protein